MHDQSYSLNHNSAGTVNYGETMQTIYEPGSATTALLFTQEMLADPKDRCSAAIQNIMNDAATGTPNMKVIGYQLKTPASIGFAHPGVSG